MRFVQRLRKTKEIGGFRVLSFVFDRSRLWVPPSNCPRDSPILPDSPVPKDQIPRFSPILPDFFPAVFAHFDFLKGLKSSDPPILPDSARFSSILPDSPRHFLALQA
jgi:hypothetical protein